MTISPIGLSKTVRAYQRNASCTPLNDRRRRAWWPYCQYVSNLNQKPPSKNTPIRTGSVGAVANPVTRQPLARPLPDDVVEPLVAVLRTRPHVGLQAETSAVGGRIRYGTTNFFLIELRFVFTRAWAGAGTGGGITGFLGRGPAPRE